MKFLRGYIFWSLVFVCFHQSTDAQRLLQIEDPKEVETVRYFEGQKITFRTKDDEKEWVTKKIKTIMVQENVIVFDDGFMHISEITHIRHPLPFRQIVGKMLMTFGGVWLVYGGVALALGLPNVLARDLITGVVPLVSGWMIQRFARRIYVMGKNGRIRLLDISFPTSSGP